MTKVFFTICDTSLQRGLPNSRNLDFTGFVNSFKKFHPDVELKVFNESDMKAHGVNYYCAKAVFGELLSREYDLVVNIDSDHYILSRLDEILLADYDIAAPINFNITDNLVAINVKSGINGGANEQTLISVKDFLQGGLIASPSKQFWQHYKYASDKYYSKFVCFENDILNLVAYLYPYKVKILDDNCYYGCSIIAKESLTEIKDGKMFCEGKQVKAYHFAHGSAKKHYTEVFPKETHSFIQSIIQ